jgi:peptidoglycan LD-endopeptidase CwlK
MTFAFGTRSLASLNHVKPELVAVLKDAIANSRVDFGVPEHAVRTLAEQARLVQQGRSQTMKSKHLPHEDGFGWAADVVPFISGDFVWEDGTPARNPHPAFYDVADAIRTASLKLNTPVTWGAVWDKILSELPAGPVALKAAVQAYNARHAGRDFNDYPHFQYGRN